MISFQIWSGKPRYLSIIVFFESFGKTDRCLHPSAIKIRWPETALYVVVGIIRNKFHKEEYVLALFLDIKCFYVIISIIGIPSDLEIHQCITNWAQNMLKGEFIHFILYIAVPQRCVISTLLWNLLLNIRIVIICEEIQSFNF